MSAYQKHKRGDGQTTRAILESVYWAIVHGKEVVYLHDKTAGNGHEYGEMIERLLHEINSRASAQYISSESVVLIRANAMHPENYIHIVRMQDFNREKHGPSAGVRVVLDVGQGTEDD